MKNILIGLVALTAMSFAGMTFAKSRSKSGGSSSSKSTKSTSKPSSNTPSKQKQDAPAKKTADTTKEDKQNAHHKNTKTHRCKLPDGKIDRTKSQKECLEANGKWVKY